MKRAREGFSGTAYLLSALAVFLLSGGVAWAGGGGGCDGNGTNSCQDGSPAMPVPQFRTITGQGTFELWPDNFQPADLECLALPGLRDSTPYNGFQQPGASNGLEFFHSLDIQQSGSSTFVYVAYNAGWQIWDATNNFASNPTRRSFRDGWQGSWQAFADSGEEFYFKVYGIDAIDPPGAPGQTLVAIHGLEDVGFTIWDATDKDEPSQLYQDLGKTGFQTVAATINGRIYAFATSSTGVQVYDMTRSREIGPCFENTSSAGNLCGGNGNPVWRGTLSPWPWLQARYLSLVEVNSRFFLAVSDGSPANPLGVTIIEVTDPSTASANELLSGLNTFAQGVALFDYSGDQYLGVVNFNQLEIYDLNSCLTTGSGCNFGNRKYQQQTIIAEQVYLTYSEANGKPFLYQGFQSLCSQVPNTFNTEYLLDVSGLATGAGVVDVIRDPVTGGEWYNDPGNGMRIDYWSSYYDQATYGFSTFSPMIGKFHGEYFYRAAQTLFDIHQLQGVAAPQPTITVDTPPDQQWLSTGDTGDAVEWSDLSGSLQPACGATPTWTWSGTNQAIFENPTQNGNNVANRVRRPLCSNDDYPVSQCDIETILVDATTNCEGQQEVSNEVGLLLSDPRPFFDFIDVAEATEGGNPQFPVCSTLDLRAITSGSNVILGKPATSYLWEITPLDGGPILTCDDSGSSSPDISCDGLGLIWNTENVDFGPEIFADAFESGDTTAWDTTVGGTAALLGDRAPVSTERLRFGGGAVRGAAALFDVKLTVANEHSAFDRTVSIELTPLGPLSLGNPPITFTEDSQNPGLYEFTAQSQNATSHRWEFEQMNGAGTDIGCQFYPRCEVIQGGAQVSYSWLPPNPDGENYRVQVTVANCDEGPLDGEVTVNGVTVVSQGPPPEVTSFQVTNCSCPGLGAPCSCPPGQVNFAVTVNDESCNLLEVDWQRQGPLSDPETIPSSCTNTTVNISHVYAAPVGVGSYTVVPTVQACQNANCGAVQILTNSNGLGELVID